MAAIDWGVVAGAVVAAGTLLLAVATFVLARRTSKLAISASDSLSATIRPVLVDVPADAPGQSPVRFDDGSVDQVDAGAIHVRGTDDYLFCSVPLRNVGPGAAVITGLGLLDPPWSGKASRMVVPSGEETRFSFSIPKDRPELKEGLQRLVDGYFILEVLYTDVDGEQPTITRAFAFRREGQPYRVRQVALLRPGEEEPFAMSGPADG